MNLKETTRDGLCRYMAAQLDGFFPDGQNDIRDGINRDLDEALDRVGTCINAVRM